MKSLTYQILLNLKNNISATINKVKEEFKAIDESAKKAGESANRFNTLCGKISNLDFSNIVSMGERAAQSMQTAIDAGFTYEQSMADLSSITGITGKELEDLGRVARETGVTSGLGAAGAADAFALLASQIQVDKIGMEGLKVLQKETITLAQAGGLAMTDAATAMAATINQFGLEASEANRVINVLAAGSKYGAAEVGDLAQSFKVTGSVAAAAGLSVEQTAGAIEVLSKSNVKGAEAGTALRNILLKMQTTLGLDLSKVGLVKALESLKPKLKDVTFLSKTFGMENVATAQFLIGNAAAVNEMTQAVTGTSVATEQAATRTATAGEKLKRMQATIDNLKIGLFEATGAFAPYISIVSEAAPALASLAIAIRMAGMAAAFAAKQNLKLKATTLANTVISKAAAAGTAVLTAANVALNAVLSANPYAMVVIAIGALVTGIVVAYNKCDAFRDIVDKVWRGIKTLASIIWDSLVGAFNAASGAIANLWNGAKSLLGIETKLEDKTNKTATANKNLATSTNDAADAASNHGKGLKGQNVQLKANLSTIEGVTRKIAELKTAQANAMTPQEIALKKEMQLWQSKLAIMEKTSTVDLGVTDAPTLKPLDAPIIKGKNNIAYNIACEMDVSQLNAGKVTIEEVTKKIADLKAAQENAITPQGIALKEEIALLQNKLVLMGKTSTAETMQIATIDGINKKLAELKTAQANAMTPQEIALKKEMQLWQSKLAIMEKTSTVDLGVTDAPTLKPLDAPIIKGKNNIAYNIACEMDVSQLNAGKVTIEEVTKKIADLKAAQENAITPQGIALKEEIALLQNKLVLMGKTSTAETMQIATIGSINKKISELKTTQESATGAQAVTLEKEIQMWQGKLTVMQANITMGAANMSTIGGLTAHMAALKTIQDSANSTQAIALEKEIRLLKKKLALMQNALMIGGAEAPDMKPLETPKIKPLDVPKIKLPITVDTSVLTGANDKIKKSMDTLKDNPYESMQSGLSGIAGTMQSLSGIVGESAGAWLTWGGSLLQTIGQAIPQIMLLAGTQVTAANAQTAANMTQAATGAAASQSAIPIVGPILAIAAIASVMAAMMAIPKPKAFANGGIVYGNTFAQVGEYAGAANNPEVIAPLNKLKTLIQPAAGFGGEVTFRIEGNALIGLLNKVNNKNSRTR